MAATVVGVLISSFALRYILATPESLLSMADTYFKIYSLGLVFQFGYNIIAAILRGIGDSTSNPKSWRCATGRGFTKSTS